MEIKNAKTYTLSAQTSFALRRTLRCYAALIEDLLAEGFDFVLPVRFQSDALERRYGQYRQMSGGRFLVSLKNVNCSEKILRIKSLLKEGIDMSHNLHFDVTTDIEEFILSVESNINDSNYTMRLIDNSRDFIIAGLIAHM